MEIYAAFGLKPEQLTSLTTSGYTVMTAADFDLEAAVSSVEVVYGWDKNAQELLKHPNHVRWIQTMSAGVDYLPLADLAKRNIRVSNTSGIHAVPIAESVLSYLLAFGRGLNATRTLAPAQYWPRTTVMQSMFTLQGKTAVIFGTGHIGQAIARLLTAFGVHVLGVSAHGRMVANFEQIGTDKDTATFLKRADFVINVMPLTPATLHFFNTERFAQMRRQPIFVNVGRGPSVDTDALLVALNQGQITGAALDVFENEPLPASSPLFNDARVLLTPHVSGTVEHLRDVVFAIFNANLDEFSRTGQLVQNQVDLLAGY